MCRNVKLCSDGWTGSGLGRSGPGARRLSSIDEGPLNVAAVGVAARKDKSSVAVTLPADAHLRSVDSLVCSLMAVCDSWVEEERKNVEKC